MLGLGQDLQKQIMKIAQSSPLEPPATAIPKPPNMEKKPLQPSPSSAGPSIPAPVRPQQFEKKTFEQAYREAVDRLNSESVSKPGLKNVFSRASNNMTNQSSKPPDVPKPAASSVSSQPSNSIVTSWIRMQKYAIDQLISIICISASLQNYNLQHKYDQLGEPAKNAACLSTRFHVQRKLFFARSALSEQLGSRNGRKQQVSANVLKCLR